MKIELTQEEIEETIKNTICVSSCMVNPTFVWSYQSGNIGLSIEGIQR
jgi:hypothetical protein